MPGIVLGFCDTTRNSSPAIYYLNSFHTQSEVQVSAASVSLRNLFHSPVLTLNLLNQNIYFNKIPHIICIHNKVWEALV